MVNQKFYQLGTAPSVIRELFAYGLEQAQVVGPENVFDYSLGNPSIPAPAKVNQSSKYGEYKSATYQQTIFETDEEKQDSHYGNYGNYQIDDKALVGYGRLMPLIVDRDEAETFRHIRF